ncbi:hypothetical protein WJX73_007026 [Symbiochloris irregularis]|uniref:4-hydroxy-3-methylbut-2-enyl diphosphate reductase n=1 Tax=Symbiochloris irregularis TaxID=706552 RepID=A0AAW1NZ73_9CHLO
MQHYVQPLTMPLAARASPGVESAEDLLQRASSNGSHRSNGNGSNGNVASTSEIASTSQAASNGTGHSNGASLPEGTDPPAKVRFDGRGFRRGLNKTGRYTRQPRNDAASLALMEEHGTGYSSTGLIAQMRENGNMWQFKNLTIKLADAYGYCWGVERAVQMAYEARQRYPEQRIHVTNEIIHNPAVNQRLKEMDINIIETGKEGKDFSAVKSEDVVILPAFGASVSEMRMMNDMRVQIVDTTCPWVSKVWNAVDNQARKQHTSVIHGKYSHEETVATASFAATYLIVRDLEQTQYLCDYILNGGNKQHFLDTFENAMSEGFDPEQDLERVGLANQTTMLRNETMQIGKLLEKTMMKRYGPENLKEHYMVLDTICDATQERQDAVTKLANVDKMVEATPPDMMLVVGGFNSSNTSHLQEIPENAGLPSFWVNAAACVDADANSIQHKLAHGELVTTQPWLPDGPLTIGVTSGASTPDSAVEQVLDKVFRIRDPSFKGIEARMELLKLKKAPTGH